MNPNRRFVYEIISVGLELQTVTPEDVLEHVTPEVLAHHLPVALKARLLQASLNAERMTAQLVIDAIGVEALVEHAPLPILWLCVRASAARQLGGAMPERSAASSTIPAPSGPGMSPMMAGLGNGGGSSADDLQLKPAKSARPTTAMRPPSRVSALSPRSRISTTLRRDDVNAALASNESGEIRAIEDEPARDFEIVEETDIARQRSSVSPNDEDTRHGPKS
jgi:hypothetical protein